MTNFIILLCVIINMSFISCIVDKKKQLFFHAFSRIVLKAERTVIDYILNHVVRLNNDIVTNKTYNKYIKYVGIYINIV